MKPYIRIVNVLIKDGNRIVNWDFSDKDTVLEILKRWNFKWVPDSARICGMPIPEELLSETVQHFVEASKQFNLYKDKLVVEIEGIPEKPPEKKKPEPEVPANDG